MYVQMQCYYSLPIFTLRALAPQDLAEQLTLSQPGGQIMPTAELRAPPPPRIFRPCDGPVQVSKS